MLSICIPTYNYLISDLVNIIHQHCTKLNIEFEINIIEDDSDKKISETNSELIGLTFINYHYQKQNKGRSATRNKLTELSKYDNILFIDCDSMPFNNNYIKNYIDNLGDNIVCGGTTYIKEQNIKGHELRYKYGYIREAVDASQRNQKPNNSFTTNNFLIKKDIINKIKFRESLTKYGHEDSLLGFELEKSNYIIKHIDNPVIHFGVETNEIFLKKTETAITNLIEIEKIPDLDKDFFKRINLTSTYLKLNKNKVTGFIRFIYRIFGKQIKNHLLNSKNPSLFIFDLYKLGYYCNLKNTIK